MITQAEKDRRDSVWADSVSPLHRTPAESKYARSQAWKSNSRNTDTAQVKPTKKAAVMPDVTDESIDLDMRSSDPDRVRQDREWRRSSDRSSYTDRPKSKVIR